MVEVFLATSPLLCLLLLLFVFRQDLSYAAILSFVLSLAVFYIFWELPLSLLGAASTKGLLLGFDIALIVGGALLFLNMTKYSGWLERMEKNLVRLAPTRHHQVFLLAWIFGGFLEGVAGFGTPAAVVAPLLITLGFRALNAVVISLVANSTAVTFGAVGTPLRVGFSGENLEAISIYSASLSIACGFAVCLFLNAYVAWTETRGNWKQEFKKNLIVSFFYAILFLTPFYLLSFLGFEFPSIGAGAFGLAVVVVFRILKSHQRFDLLSFTPYFLFVSILVVLKFLLAHYQTTLTLSTHLQHSFSFFHPGFAFILASLLTLYFSKQSFLRRSTNEALKGIAKPFATIFLIAAMVQILIQSRYTPTDHLGALELMASFLSESTLIYVAPLMGAFGSFLTGSATVSNLLFAPLQREIVQLDLTGLPFIFALQLVGAALGNMISLTNILAVKAAAQAEASVQKIFSRTLPPCLALSCLLILTAYFLR